MGAPRELRVLTHAVTPRRASGRRGVRDGITWVNDSTSTTPPAGLAAVDVFRDRRVALLAGGHDRGLDWAGFAEAMKARAPVAIVTMGQNGARIHETLA